MLYLKKESLANATEQHILFTFNFYGQSSMADERDMNLKYFLKQVIIDNKILQDSHNKVVFSKLLEAYDKDSRQTKKIHLIFREENGFYSQNSFNNTYMRQIKSELQSIANTSDVMTNKKIALPLDLFMDELINIPSADILEVGEVELQHAYPSYINKRMEYLEMLKSIAHDVDITLYYNDATEHIFYDMFKINFVSQCYYKIVQLNNISYLILNGPDTILNSLNTLSYFSSIAHRYANMGLLIQQNEKHQYVLLNHAVLEECKAAISPSTCLSNYKLEDYEVEYYLYKEKNKVLGRLTHE